MQQKIVTEFGLNRNLSIETLLEDFKPRDLEHDESEYTQNNNNNCTFQHFQPVVKKLLHLKKLRNFNSKTDLKIESYQLTH